MFQFKCVSEHLNKVQQWKDKPQSFAYLKRITKRQLAFCYSVAIHPISPLFINGFNESIKVYCIVSINGAMKEIYKLKNHFQEVTCLKFLRNTEQFISASFDKSIKIWTKNSQWIVDQTLSEHDGYISSFVLNNEENLLVSSSSDKSIKFWVKKLNWQCSQTITCHKGVVYNICLNQSEDKLITCGQDGQIFVIQKQFDQSWIVSQHINFQVGLRLQFITDNLFAYQQIFQDVIDIFEYDEIQKEFKKSKEVEIQKLSFDTNFFPLQYIDSKQLLVAKQGKCLNLIQKTDNNLKTEASIVFGSFQLFGTMSQDGNVLLTWDDESKQIQLRKYREYI